MATYKIHLTDEDGVLLDSWRVDVTGEDDDALDLRKKIARLDLVEEIVDEIDRREGPR